MWQTWVRSLGWEDPLEKGKATHPSIVAWRIPWTVHGVPKSRTQLSDFHFHFPRWLSGKESTCNAGDVDSIPGSGRSPGEGNGNPFQYSYLENPKQKSLEGYNPWGGKRVRHDLVTKQHQLFGKGNYTQYLIINYTRKKSEKSVYN